MTEETLYYGPFAGASFAKMVSASQNVFRVIPNPPRFGQLIDPPTHSIKPMTSKQVQKAFRERTKVPKLSRAEQRRLELAEQERIRKELEHERSLARQRAARERKRLKEEQAKEEKRKKGLPLVPVRPSQDLIAKFVRKRPAAEMDSVGEGTEGSDKENATSQPRAKRTIISQSPQRSGRASQIRVSGKVNERHEPEKDKPRSQTQREDSVGVDDPLTTELLEEQLQPEAGAALRMDQSATLSPPSPKTIEAQGMDEEDDSWTWRPEEDANTLRLTDEVSLILGLPDEIFETPRLSSEDSYAPKAPGGDPHTPRPSDERDRRRPTETNSSNEQAPIDRGPVEQSNGHVTVEQTSADKLPTSTQLFLLNNFDDFFPSPTQEEREVNDLPPPEPPRSTVMKPVLSKAAASVEPPVSKAAVHLAPRATATKAQFEMPFLSTQDLILSSQDLRELGDTPSGGKSGTFVSAPQTTVTTRPGPKLLHPARPRQSRARTPAPPGSSRSASMSVSPRPKQGSRFVLTPPLRPIASKWSPPKPRFLPTPQTKPQVETHQANHNQMTRPLSHTLPNNNVRTLVANVTREEVTAQSSTPCPDNRNNRIATRTGDQRSSGNVPPRGAISATSGSSLAPSHPQKQPQQHHPPKERDLEESHMKMADPSAAADPESKRTKREPRRFFTPSAQENTMYLVALYRSRETAVLEERGRQAAEVKRRVLMRHREELGDDPGLHETNGDHEYNTPKNATHAERNRRPNAARNLSSPLHDPRPLEPGSQETDYGDVEWDGVDLAAIEADSSVNRSVKINSRTTIVSHTPTAPGVVPSTQEVFSWVEELSDGLLD